MAHPHISDLLDSKSDDCNLVNLTSKNNNENVSAQEKCSKWLDTLDTCTETSSEYSYATSTNTTDTNGSIEKALPNMSENKFHVNKDVISVDEILNSSDKRFENIHISKSRRVQIGTVTYINGPVHINQSIITLNQNTQEDSPNKDKYVNTMNIIPRRAWLAQPPIKTPIELKKPAKFVIICHTATEEARTSPENMYLIRLLQTFHIEGMKWSDIAFNFLVAGDGRVYEGRGWNIVGAHTDGFNDNSVGIAFVGSYLNNLPHARVLKEAQELIKLGVSIGVVDPKYSLISQSQVSSSNPADALYEEIKTWDNWNSSLPCNDE